MATVVVTADDIRELLTSDIVAPILVRWLDTKEVTIVPLASLRGTAREFEILAAAQGLREVGGWEVTNPTDELFAELAEIINEIG